MTGSGTTYDVAASDMSANGTVIASIAAGVAIDAGGNPNAASTSSDNTVTFNGILSTTVTVTGHAGNMCSFTVTVTSGTSVVDVYPVPSKGNFSIVVCPELSGATVRAFNANGMRIAEWIVNTGLSNYQFERISGVYLLEFTKGPIREVRTIIISR